MPSRFRFKCLTVEKTRRSRRSRFSCRSSSTRSASTWRSKPSPLDELGPRFKAGNYDAILAERTTAVHCLDLPRLPLDEAGWPLQGGRRHSRPPARRDRRLRRYAPTSATCSRFFTTIRRPSLSPGRRSPGWSAQSSTFLIDVTVPTETITGTDIIPSNLSVARRRIAMRRITYRFVLLIASAAIAPLLLYGSSPFATCSRERNRRSGKATAGWRIRSRKRSASTWTTTRACCRRLVSSCAAPTWSRGSRRACSRTSS